MTPLVVIARRMGLGARALGGGWSGLGVGRSGNKGRSDAGEEGSDPRRTRPLLGGVSDRPGFFCGEGVAGAGRGISDFS